MNVIYKKIEEIIPYENNPRNNENAIDKVANSINEFGFKVPLVLDKNNVIITGHTRYLASKKLGLEQVPCIIADDLSKAQIKAYRIADNKVSEFSNWNEDLLKLEFESLIDLNFDLELTGFGDIEIMTFTEDVEPESFDDKEFEEYDDISEEENLKAHNVIISCFNEEEKEWLKNLFRETRTDVKRLYKCEEIMERYND